MARPISGLKRTEYSTATHLLAYGLAIALPLLVLLGFLLYRSVSLERSELENRILQLVADLADDIDRDLNAHLTVLQALAVSPYLEQEDWPAFHILAKAALQGTAYLILVDASGRQIVNTYVPYGEAPPFTGDPETVRRIVEARRPMVSNLFVSLVTETPAFNVGIPIERDGTVRYVMSLGLLPADLLTVLRGQRLEPGWVSTVWDRNGTILARSRDHDRYVTKQLPPRLQSVRSGVFQAINVDGEPVLRATASSKLSGWSVAVNAPVTLVEQQLRSSLWVWAGTALAAGILAIGLGLLLGRGLAEPLSVAATAASLLGRGQPIEAWHSRVKEANRFIEALLTAQKELDDRTNELRDRERQLRTAAEAAQFGAHEYDVASDRVRWSRQLKELLGVGHGADDPVTLETAISFIHPEDRPRVRQQMHEILAGSSVRYELEFRVVRRDGAVRWVMDRGQAIKNPGTGRVARVAGILLDITELKSAEESQRLLIDELNHRVKNTLAIVQSIAMHTMRTKTDPKEFTEAFSARLGSLAGAHNLLTRGAWQGASLRDIVDAALAPFRTGRGAIQISGDPIMVPANATITLSLMLHELATNAAKYGALNSTEGGVAVSWQATKTAHGTMVDLQWIERGGPAVRKPDRKGFGTRLLEASALQLGCELGLDYLPEGLRCRIKFPLHGSKA